MNNTFISELSSLKDLLVKPTHSSPIIQEIPHSSATSSNPWSDEQRTDNLRHTMAISKDENGKPVDLKHMEKICVENGISVHKTFDIQKSASTGIVVNSKVDADILRQKLTVDLPMHKVEQVATKMPAITVVGLQMDYDKD